MTKTSATIPIKENDSQYYAGQYGPLAIAPLLNGQTATVAFSDLNTTLISNYNIINGEQLRDTGNFTIHLLATSTTIPSASNQVNGDFVIVTNSSNNTIQVKNPYTTANFIFLQLSSIATGDNYGSYGYLRLDDIINNFLVIYIGEDKILDKWESLGFLDNLLLPQQIKLAHGMEYTAETLIADDGSFNEEIDTQAFPVLRKIITVNPNIDLTNDFIINTLTKLSDFTKSREYSDGMTSNNYVNAIDMEAELLHLFVETNYGK